MTKVSDYAKLCEYTAQGGTNPTKYESIYKVPDVPDNFDAQVYKQGNEIIICYEASKDYEDVNDNIGILVGNIFNFVKLENFIPIQLEPALQLYLQIKSNFPNCEITLTGHSYGGALAALVAYITGEKSISFGCPGLKYATNILTKEYILEHYIISEDLIKCDYSNINNYSNMNDPIGNYGDLIGNQYFLEPNPQNDTDDNPMRSPHQMLNVFFDEQNISNAFQYTEWKTKYSCALFYYDSNNTKRDTFYEFIKLINNVTENDLKTAIDMLIEKIKVPSKTLSYTIKEGMYIIGSKNNNDEIHSGISKKENTKGNDFIIGNHGKDLIFAFNGNDILIGDSTSYKVRDLENFRDNIGKLRQNPNSIDITKFESKNDGNDKLYGGSGNDIVIGGGGSDYLDGGDNDDIIYGGSGDDTITGGRGNDILVGGIGNDTYIINSGDGCDTIYDSALIDNSDGLGHIQYNGNILYGAFKKSKIKSGYWLDLNKNLYYWDGKDGSDLIINNKTIVKNFQNGQTLGILLGIYDDEPANVPPYNPTMYPVPPFTNNPKQTPLPESIDELYPDLFPKIKPAIGSDGYVHDPVILDLDGNGLEVTNIYNGTYFDYADDGFAEVTAWIKGNDGILVIDKNNNGIIENESELLTNETLSLYDSNNDNIIDENDENIDEIKVLRSDGTLQSLADAGIKFINLNTKEINNVDEFGNTQFASGTFGKIDGSIHEYGEFLLQTDTSNSFNKNEIEISNEVAVLPEIRNWGKSRTLQQAIMIDESGTLKELIESFISETNDEVRMNLVDQILEKWANATEIAPDSRGEYINAKKLSIIETFMGIEFVSTHEAEENPNNPNIEAAQILNTIYEELKVYIYAELMSQSHLEDLVAKVSIIPNEEGTLKFNYANVVSALAEELETNPEKAKERIYEFAKYIKGFGYDTKSNFFDPKDDECFYLKFTKDDRELKWLIDTIGKVPYTDEIGDGEGSAADDSYRLEDNGHFHALSGDDVAYGSDEDDNFAMCSGDDLVDAGDGNDIIDTHGGNDIIFAGAGDDVIHASDGDDIIFGDDGDDLIYPDHGDDFNYAQDGNDTIRGGKGNDTIHSMVGDDTFIFYRGDGQDVVFEHQGIDTLYFGPDITWDDLIFEQDGNDMVISIQDTEDKITIKDWFLTDEDGVYRYDNHKIEIFEFADGSKHYKDEITVGDNTESITYNMNEHEDHIDLASNYKTTVNLKQGWNDVVAGQNSDDTYVLNTEQTNVLIQDYDGNNTIKFGDGIQLAQTFFAYNEDGLEIWFEYFDAHMQIQGDIDSFKFEFADGTVLTDIASLLQRDISYVDYIMNENQEELRLIGNDSLTVIDNDRDSNIITNNGDTTIDFGQGHTNVESINGGNDVYIYNLGDCDKYINDFGGIDTIKFGEGITTENIHFLKDLQNNNLEIWFDLDYDNNDRLTIENFFGNDNNKIEYFEFADGSVIDDVEEYIRAWGSRHDEDLEIPENIQEAHLRGEGHITAIGNDNDNHFNGGFGDNSFIGGKGNDGYWDDCKTNERYYYNVGDGHDNISDIGGIDAIIFGEGITKENIRFTQEPENLIIWFDGIEDASICVQNYFIDDENKIELFKFADGSVIDNIEPYIREVVSRDNNIVLTETQENAYLWDNADLNVTGNQYDNYIETNEGNNTIDAKGGDDFIQDAGGNDVYIYNIGDGNDTILDHGGYDKIAFGEGITSSNIIFGKINNHLNIKFNGAEGSILVVNYFDEEVDNKIEVFEFSDGSQITDISELYEEVEPEENDGNENYQPYIPQNNYDHLQNGSIVMDADQTTATLTGNKDAYVLGNSNDNTVTGNAGNNTYALGGGNDTVIDTQGGDDTYHYNLNNGHDVITDVGGVDTVRFGRDIFPHELRFEQVEHNLVISFRDENRDGSLTINGYFLDTDHKIENFVFDDETVINDITDMLTGTAVFEDHEVEEDSNIEVVRMAGTENISVTGNSQNNLIIGNSGNNTFEGKGGDDVLIDHAGGNDTYIYNIGDGNDTIDDIGGIDTIKFGPDVTLENLAFEKTSTDLNIWFHNIENNGLTIKDYFSNEAKKIEKFELADGTVITDISNYITAIASENDVTLPNGVSQIHLWGNGNTTATGNDEDNWIGGNDGDNTIIGGKGNDYLYDDRNTNETYIYNLGDGHDCINDFGGYDVIQFGEGISKENLVFIMNKGDLLINFKDDEGNMLDGSIRIEGHFWEDNRKVEKIEFADGSTLTNLDRYITILASENDFQNYWNFAEVHLWGENNIKVTGSYSDEIFFGNNGNNTYDPQGGVDRINAGTGNDTYIYNHDYQDKFIIDMGGEDVIKFGSGIDIENTKFVRNDNNLRIYFQNNGNGFIQIEDYFVNDERKIERFEFANGTVITNITDNMIKGQASSGNITLNENEDCAYLLGDGDASVIGNDNENNFIYGNSGNNTFNGKGGHDHIESTQGGDDTYIYNIGDGHDYIIDIGGNDVVKFGEGISLDNVRFTHKRNDLQVFVDIGEEGGSIHIDNYFKSDLRKIERFEFADGTVITDVSELISGIDIDSDYTFDEDTQITEVYMKGRENLSVTGNNQDNHVEGNEGNNTYNLKGGNDSVHDYDGDDTYIYNLGDGDDFYEDENGFDTLQLGEGITQDILRMERQDNGNLRIWFAGKECGITICGHFGNDNKKLERIILSDGTEITDFTPFFDFVETEEDYTIAEGSHVRDVIAVGTNNVTLTGNNDDNHFEGNEGNTTFEGKGGNDSFHSDKGGNDTYVYNLGDGFDFITDIGGNDTIVLGEGITSDMIRMRRQWIGNLEIFFDGEEGNIVIQDYFNNDANKIEKIVLADNTEITDFEQFFNFEVANSDYTLPEESNKSEIVISSEDNISVTGNSQDNHVEGNLGNNTYELKGGNDDVYDPDGDDTYIYNLGDGHEFYNDDGGFDTLQFGQGITQDMLRMEQHENGNLHIWFEGQEGGITICEHFGNDNKRLEKIVLFDGTEITDFEQFMPNIDVDSDYTLPEEGVKRDVIVNGGNDITINGNSRDNYIEINTQGNVTVQVKGGNDFVNEQAGGNTTYIYNQGDGWNTIRDIGGYDTVKFGAGLNVSDIKVMNRNGNGIEIWFNGVDGNLVIENCLENPDNKIERFEFADGTVIENIEDYINCIASENNIELPESYKEAHLWGEGDTSATGNDEDNWIGGNSGHNTFNGKKGNDSYFDNQGGDDTFIYNLGDGYDNIANIGGYDIVQFGAGITESMLRFERCDNGDLEIFIDADTEENCGSLRIQNYFNDNEWKIEKIILADNTEITDLMSRAGVIEVDSNYTISEDSNINYVIIKGENDVNITGNSQDNHIDGNEANNTYNLKGGNDYVYEPGGNDVYIYNQGDGWDTIRDCSGYDTVKFGAGLNVSDMKVMNRNGNGIEIWFNGVDGNLVIENCLENPDNKIERFEFADGTVIENIEDYINCIASENNIELPEGYKEAHLWGEGDTSATGNDEDNHFNGNSGNNTFNGKKGNDSYFDNQGGDDTFIYNLGDGYDNIANIGGYDIIQFGEGITESMLRFERCDNGDLEIFIDADTEENCGSIRIQNHFNGDEWRIEKVILADETEITDLNARAGVIEVDSNYTISEDSNLNYVMVKGENDVNITGNSQDNHIDGNEANNTYNLKGGNDFVYDPNGNDSYIYNLGDENLTIHDGGGYDKIILGEGIVDSDLTFLLDDHNNIHINFIDKEGEIMIINQNGDVNNQIEEIVLADGTIVNNINSRITRIGSEFNNINLPDGYTEAQLWGEQNLNATGNNNDNFIGGNIGNNTFNGQGGNDNIYDPDGNDTYIYNIGDGDDFYHDEGGFDTLQFGQGITQDMIRMERQDGNLIISFADQEGSITIYEHFVQDHKQLERIVLFDGTEINDFSSFITCDDEPEPDTPIDEEPPVIPTDDDFDVNMLIQEINSYGVDNDVVMTDTQNQNNEELLLVMGT